MPKFGLSYLHSLLEEGAQMNLQEMTRKIKKGETDRLFFTDEVREKIAQFSTEEIESRLEGFTRAPMIRKDSYDMQLSSVYHILSWEEAFRNLVVRKDSTLIEIAPGAGTHIVTVFDLISGGKGKYVAFNLNKKLTSDLKSQTEDLNLDIRIIEDDAKNAPAYIPNETIDIVAGNHAINDILETIIANKEGLDTVEQDWFEIAPGLMREYEKAYLNGTLRNLVFDDFIDIMRAIYFTLKPGGYLVLNYYVYPVEIDWGGSVPVRSAFVNLARQWIGEADIGFETLSLDGFDPKWWGFFRKCQKE